MGFVASLPFLLKAIVGPLGGVVADILRNGHMSTVNVRRLFYILGKICNSYNADLLSWMRPKLMIAFRSAADNRPFSYSAKEPGSSVIFIHFYTRDSIEWR